MNRSTIDSCHHVTRFQTRTSGRRSLLNRRDQRAARVIQSERSRDIGIKILNRNAKLAANDLAMLDQLGHHQSCDLGRYGEADTDVAASRAEDRGVDPHKPAVKGYQRAARVAGIDRSVRLDKIFITIA